MLELGSLVTCQSRLINKNLNTLSVSVQLTGVAAVDNVTTQQSLPHTGTGHAHTHTHSVSLCCIK